MTRRERIVKMMKFEKPDRVPLLGGWINSDAIYQEISGVTEETFWENPTKYALEVYRSLSIDGLVGLAVPSGKGLYRGEMTKESFYSYKQRFNSPEDVLAYVESLPSKEEALKNFDAQTWREKLVESIKGMQEKVGEMVWMPTLWNVVNPNFQWYNTFGYDNYMLFLGLYPEATDKLFSHEAVVCRLKSAIVVEVYQQLDCVPIILLGTDICGKDGPVVSPAFLRQYFFPHVRFALEPFFEAGFRTIWHSDGYIIPIVDDILGCGVSGFQGFQWEYGVKLEELVSKRTKSGKKLTIFAGPSVAATLRFGSEEDVRNDVEHIIDTALGKCALFILPASHILPGTPTHNVVEFHHHAVNHGREAMLKF